ncbi:RNA polymerase sigma-70 factor [Pedobacter sp.]|uniref:RNA polymerase sigma factor n=1 Tax=Pedobacter sp. TaxID=1411316 RepID=UPI0031D9BF26
MNNSRVHTDQELFEALKGGEVKVFNEIYERYFGLLYRHAYQMLRDRVQAEDVVQDIFQMLLEKCNELELRHSLKAFLYSSIRFRILKQFRHNKVVENYLSTIVALSESTVQTIDIYIEEKELAKRIEDGLSKLPSKMRQIFELSRIDELSYKEISEKLNVTEHTVRKQMSNALKIMRSSFKNSFILFF